MSPKLVELAASRLFGLWMITSRESLECEFNDADGHRHTLRDKVPIFHNSLLVMLTSNILDQARLGALR